MINQDEVFVITEDDILKPGDRKGKGGASPRSAPIAFAKPARAEKKRDIEETVAERPAVARSGRAAGHPAAAGSLSLFVWGLGQLYNGDTRLAALFMVGEALVASFHYLVFKTWAYVKSYAHLFFVSEWELMLYVSSIDLCLIFFMIYNVAQAYRRAEERAGRFEGIHQPAVSGVASLVVPGWGQMLNGQLGKASFFLFVFLLQIYLWVLFVHSPFYAVVADLDPQGLFQKKVRLAGMGILNLMALSWMLSVYDAFLVARYTRRLNG
jgi:TM2 domain-containing membrane protein YozV